MAEPSTLEGGPRGVETGARLPPLLSPRSLHCACHARLNKSFDTNFYRVIDVPPLTRKLRRMAGSLMHRHLISQWSFIHTAMFTLPDRSA
jgi:hypothetical protein